MLTSGHRILTKDRIVRAGFFMKDNVMRHRSVWSSAVGCSSHVIEDWM